MIIALFLFVGLLMVSAVFTYLVVSLLDADKIHTEPAMDALIQTNLALMVTSTVDLVGDIFSIAVGRAFVFISGLPSQALNLARFGAVVGVAVAFHEGYSYFLSGGDTLFRTLLGPFFQDVLFSLLQIIRLVYDALIPVYNYYSTIIGQITAGSISIAIKCDMTTVVETIKLILFTFISLFKSISDFAGKNEIYDNAIVNDWNLTQTFYNTQLVISHQEKIASCICDGLTDIFDLGFIIVGTPHLPRLLNHLFNIPIAVIQEVIQLLPPYSKMPLMTKLVYHVGSAGLEAATYVDKVGLTLFEKIIQLFVPEFYLKGAPEQFICATQARLWLAGMEAAHVVYRTVLHMIIPIPKFITNPDYMMKAMDFEKALLHLGLWNHGNTNMMHWVGMLSSKIIKGSISNLFSGESNFVLEGVPEHVLLDCTKPSRYGYIKGPCAVYYGVQIPINLLYGGNKLIGELLWKSLFFQEQYMWPALQRYDGIMLDREIHYSCEYRRDYMEWDKTRGKCRCEIPVGNFPLKITAENPFGDNQLYDPYCGQPSLQANYWYPLVMQFRMAFEGFLMDAWFFPLKLAWMEVIEWNRLVVRTVLAMPQIVTGNYLDVPMNCGWGDDRIWSGEIDDIPCMSRRHTRNEIDYCTGNNTAGCTCNPSLPLEYNSTCKCIFYYPDAEQEVTQKAFRNDLLTNLYNNQHHWCGSYHFENYFALADELAYRIDDILSQFAPAYNSENNDYCESMAYDLLATDVLQYNEDEWDNALLGNVSNITYSYKKESCQLYGSYDIICSASMTWRTGVFLVTQQARWMTMTAFSFLELDTQNFKLDFSERLCDLQRAAAGASASVAAMFPVKLVGPGVQQGLARMMYSGLDTIIVNLRFYNNFLLWFSDIIRGATTGKSIEQPTFDLIVNQLNLIIDWMRRVFQAFGTFMDGIHRGAGKFFFTIDRILTIFKKIMSQAVLELFALIAKVIGGIVELFSAGGVIDNFFTDLWLLISKFFSMLLRQMSKLWSIIVPVLEPLMKVIRAIGGAFKSVCQTIESAICALSFDSSCSIGCSSMRGTGHQHVFFSSPDTPLHIAEKINWDGVSRCDIMVHRYKNYTWNQLRPLEQIEIQECLEQRYIADQIANITDLPIPKDLLYNWKRKYVMGYDVGHASILYLRHVFGDLGASEMMRIMKHDHVNLDLYLPALNKIRSFASSTFTMKNVDRWVHTAFQEYPNVLHGDTGVSNMYRFYIHASKFATEAYPHAMQLGHEFKVMKNSIHASAVLKRRFDVVEHISDIKKSLSRIPPMFKQFSSKRPTTHSKLKAQRFVSPILGAAGLNVDIRPCHEQEDTYVCLNCVIVDNLLNTVIKEGERMSNYYVYTYAEVIIPSFVDYFEKQERRAKSYREDMGALLEDAASRAFENITGEANNAGTSLRRSFSNATQALSPMKLAGKDWEYLFANWAIRNDLDFVDIGSKFLSTVDDTYVPFTGYGLGYIITYPFANSCSMEVIYCTTSTTQQRLTYISAQWGYQLAVWAGLYGLQQYTQFPVYAMATMAPNSFIISVAIYMYAVYGYLYTCLPNIPNCLVDDIFAWLHDVAYPQCFCQYYPGLADSCDPELCFLASKSTTFSNCTAEVPLSSFDNMGYLWSPTFWFRTEFPDAFIWLYRTAPFSWALRNFDGVKDIAIRLQEDIPITLSEIDCLGLRYTDIVMAGIVVYVVSFALGIIIPIGFKLSVHFFKMAVLFFNVLFAFGVATEVSTVVGIKNTYQD